MVRSHHTNDGRCRFRTLVDGTAITRKEYMAVQKAITARGIGVTEFDASLQEMVEPSI